MAARATRISRYALPRWRKPAAAVLLFTTLITVALVGIGFYHIYVDRSNLPDLEPFVRFEFPTIGHVYDINGQPLVEMATEHRWIGRYEDIRRWFPAPSELLRTRTFSRITASTMQAFRVC